MDLYEQFESHAIPFPAFASVETGISGRARVHRLLAPLPDVTRRTVGWADASLLKFICEILRHIGDQNSIEPDILALKHRQEGFSDIFGMY